jgi:hypothetical protein
VAKQSDEVRRRIAFRNAMWHAIACIALESGRAVEQLAEEAFRDLLKKHRRPATLRDALRESVRMPPTKDHRPPQGVGGHRKLNDIYRTRPFYFWGPDGCLVVPPALVGLSLIPVVFDCAGPDRSAKNM